MRRDLSFNVHFTLLVLIGLVATSLPLPIRGQSNQLLQSDNIAAVQQAVDSPQTPPAQTQPPGEKEPPWRDTLYSRGALLVTIVLFAVLGFLFFLQIYWSNHLDQVGYLGTLYRDTIEEIEYKRLISDYELVEREYLDQVSQDNQWLQDNPQPDPPPGYRPLSRYGRPASRPGRTGSGIGGLGGSGWSTGSGTENPYTQEPADPKVIEYENLREDWQARLQAEAQKRYLAKARQRASELAKKAINIDISVLYGRGPEFVLGFTTIVAIVFAAVALGVLHLLDSQQIGTLFAAIAGYVLGRATAQGTVAPGSHGVTSPTPTPAPTPSRAPGSVPAAQGQ